MNTAPQNTVGPTVPADTALRVPFPVPGERQIALAAEAQVAAEWRVGDVILDLYEVKHIFEGGGMGLVYRVHHKGWNIDLAVKSPRANYFQTEMQKENFGRECETWINLGLHPHVVGCHYVRTLGGIPRVFAEYVEGGSLKEWIDNRKLYEGGPREALKRILDIAIQMAWGLQYAHEHEAGLIHQDVKPANVLMMPDGTAKITDFGLAKARAMVGEKVLAGSQQSILVSCGGNTPAYCSPEQANKAPLSRQTDIWSWAVSVLEMLVGEVCWQSGTAAPEMLKHLGEAQVEGVGVSEPPLELLTLLGQCFAAEPGGRPENFRVVADNLRSIHHNVAGDGYMREFPEAAKIQADGLNNRAVSMLDLGRAAEAEKLFDQALAMDSSHPQATYNRGLHLWRNGRVTDAVLATVLKQSQANRPGDWNVPYLMGLVHLERRDAKGAAAALSAAEKLKGGAEVEQALAEARRMETSALRCLRTFDGYKNDVNSVALSADGRWALSGSGSTHPTGKENTLCLWDMNSGKCRETFDGHTDMVLSVALSADGRWALSGSRDKTIRLWELSSGKCVGIISHTGSVVSVALSADGRWALSGGYDKWLRLWDMTSKECCLIFEGHTQPVGSVALSADSRWAVSGSNDATVRFWEVGSGKCLGIFRGHTGSISSVALSADGRWALSGSDDKTLRFWEVSSGKCLRTFEGHTGDVKSVAISKDGYWALSGSSDKTLRVWEMRSGMCLRTFDEHWDSVESVALSADGRWALTASERTLRLWDVSGLRDKGQTLIASFALCRLADTKETLIVQKQFHALLSAAREALSEGNFARAWSLAAESKTLAGYGFATEATDMARQAGLRGKRNRLRSASCWRALNEKTHSTALSADGRWFLSGGDSTISLWEVSSGKYLRGFDGHSGLVRAVALSADSRWAVSGSNDATVRFWEVGSGKCLGIFSGHTGHVNSVALSTDGRWALSGSSDKTLRLWDLSSGKCLRIFEGNTEEVASVALSADGRWALSGSGVTLRLWEVSSGECLRTFGRHRQQHASKWALWKWIDSRKGALSASVPEGEHAAPVCSVALSADGRWALSGSNDNTLRLWEVRSARCHKILRGHTGHVNSVALSPDGRWALSGSHDKTLRLWDLGTGKCLRIFEGHTREVRSSALSSDGRWVLSGSWDDTLRVWELEWDHEFPEQKDWDEAAKPYLEIFLNTHCVVGVDGFTRVGKPTWAEDDFEKLLVDLQYNSYGWLRPEGVRNQLEQMMREWQGPTLMPWEQKP